VVRVIELVALVDGLLDGPALVVGRRPPGGRDLDLLVRDEREAAALAGALRERGFEQLDGRWVRFAACRVDIVDIVDAGAWGLEDSALDEAFGSAAPIDGAIHLRGPSKATTVLLEAKRWADGGLLTDRRRARVHEALTHDGVRAEVERRAAAWRLGDAVASVIRPSEGSAMVRRARRRLSRPAGTVISFSGVDGSGKSSQVEALRSTLESLGYDVETVWTRITINPSLSLVGRPVKRVLGGLAGLRSGRASTSTDGRSSEHDAARELRERNAWINALWITFVALVNALAVRRATARALLRGAVVICDRYTLDSAAHLRYKYGADRTYRRQSRLIRALTPRPIRSYHLDVDGRAAFARKPEKYTPEQLVQLSGLYRQEREWLGVERLDGELPREELCATIGRDVALALASRAHRRRPRRRTER